MKVTMADRYKNFLELAKKETQGIDFRVRLQQRAGKAVVLAPHGGGIEPGTSELAEAIAGADLSFYAFEGIKPADNRILHITSARFDEPQGKVLAEASPTVIAVHREESAEEVVFLGGLDEERQKKFRDSLIASGFTVKQHHNPLLQGTHDANICNQGASDRGVQMELSKGFLIELCHDGGKDSLDRSWPVRSSRIRLVSRDHPDSLCGFLRLIGTLRRSLRPANFSSLHLFCSPRLAIS
jgi:phage replication-related protein YjqB (UPF0714/DUF867 family)